MVRKHGSRNVSTHYARVVDRAHVAARAWKRPSCCSLMPVARAFARARMGFARLSASRVLGSLKKINEFVRWRSNDTADYSFRDHLLLPFRTLKVALIDGGVCHMRCRSAVTCVSYTDSAPYTSSNIGVGRGPSGPSL